MAQFEDPAKIVADYNAAHPEVGSLTDEGVAYITKLAQPTLAERENKTAPDGFGRAIDNFKADVLAKGVGNNIHQQAASEIKLDVERGRLEAQAAPSADQSFDSTALETDLGITPGAMDKLGITDHTTATQAIRGIAQATANAATDDELESQINSWSDNEPAVNALRATVLREIDKWDSPLYGKGESRNSAQIVESYKLLNHALKQNIGLAKNNHKAVGIEVLLKRARYALDPDHRPASSASVSRPAAQQRDAGFGNIHFALQANVH